jgi:hypothetical protein
LDWYFCFFVLNVTLFFANVFGVIFFFWWESVIIRIEKNELVLLVVGNGWCCVFEGGSVGAVSGVGRGCCACG